MIPSAAVDGGTGGRATVGGGTLVTTGPVRGGSSISTIAWGAFVRCWKNDATRDGSSSWFAKGRAASTRRRGYVSSRTRVRRRVATANGLTFGSKSEVSTLRDLE
ncbi:MAG: hypothetical protein IPP07_03300 [Holophagales bacterium]|nr:hypothetical protein [Holophagales bacterium]